MGHGHMMLRKIERLAQQLDLQDDQETQVQAIDAIVRQTGERPLRPPEE